MVQVIVDVISNVPGIIFWWQNARQLEAGRCQMPHIIFITELVMMTGKLDDLSCTFRKETSKAQLKQTHVKQQQPRTSAQKQRCQSSQFNNSRTTWISSCYPLNHPISTSKPCPNQGNKLQTYPQTRLPGCHINICRRLLMKVLGAVWSWKMELDLQDWCFPHIQQL